MVIRVAVASPTFAPLRDRDLRQLPARELVPGDRIELAAGDNVPADARLMATFGVRVQEAPQTMIELVNTIST